MHARRRRVSVPKIISLKRIRPPINLDCQQLPKMGSPKQALRAGAVHARDHPPTTQPRPSAVSVATAAVEEFDELELCGGGVNDAAAEFLTSFPV